MKISANAVNLQLFFRIKKPLWVSMQGLYLHNPSTKNLDHLKPNGNNEPIEPGEHIRKPRSLGTHIKCSLLNFDDTIEGDQLEAAKFTLCVARIELNTLEERLQKNPQSMGEHDLNRLEILRELGLYDCLNAEPKLMATEEDFFGHIMFGIEGYHVFTIFPMIDLSAPGQAKGYEAFACWIEGQPGFNIIARQEDQNKAIVVTYPGFQSKGKIVEALESNLQLFIGDRHKLLIQKQPVESNPGAITMPNLFGADQHLGCYISNPKTTYLENDK